MPEYFHDDWLNEYHDMRRTASAPAATDVGGHGGPTTDAVHGSDDVAIEQSTADEIARSRLADSDYRFVYLGPRVCCSGTICVLPCRQRSTQRQCKHHRSTAASRSLSRTVQLRLPVNQSLHEGRQ